MHLWISKNQHVTGNYATYDEGKQTSSCKQPFWSTNGGSIKLTPL